MIQKDRINFYKRNPQLVNKIKSFFKDVEKGMRCRALEVNGGDGKRKFLLIDGLNKRYSYPLTNRIDDWVLENAITIHWYNAIFDKKIVKNRTADEVDNFIIGLTPIMDIDAKKTLKGKVDILSKQKYLEDMISLIHICEKKWEEIGLNIWDDKIQFSGNGFYIIFNENLYGEYSELKKDDEKYIGLVDDINTLFGREAIDNRYHSWNRFFKVPYTFHRVYNRLSIPLNKSNFDDLDYLRYASDYKNYNGGVLK